MKYSSEIFETTNIINIDINNTLVEYQTLENALLYIINNPLTENTIFILNSDIEYITTSGGIPILNNFNITIKGKDDITKIIPSGDTVNSWNTLFDINCNISFINCEFDASQTNFGENENESAIRFYGKYMEFKNSKIKGEFYIGIDISYCNDSEIWIYNSEINNCRYSGIQIGYNWSYLNNITYKSEYTKYLYTDQYNYIGINVEKGSNIILFSDNDTIELINQEQIFIKKTNITSINNFTMTNYNWNNIGILKNW